ncbi:MAG: S8 family serine peptidase [Pyrinomonadaceae bacterium]|nr:S8 family serine peptidase [Pyrinomonadaceae bacterium]
MSGQLSRKHSERMRLRLALVFFSGLILLLASSLLPISQATFSPQEPGGSGKKSKAEFVPGEVLVRFRTEALAKQQTQLDADSGMVAQTVFSEQGREIAVRVERFEGSDIVPGLRIARVAAADTLAAIEALRKQPNVLYAEPNYLLYADATPNDPRFLSNDLYGLTTIGAPQAWDTTTGSASVVVGVIDEGIDRVHQDLQANIWVNPADNTVDGMDNDANGFIDDVNGYNFIANSGAITADSHGTHVGGTIGAVGNNGIGVVGVNWNVRLMSLKFLGGTGSGNTANAIRACNYAKQMRELWVSSAGTKGSNLRVLNNSYGGGGFSQAFLDAIGGLNQSAILFVASAGNTSTAPEPNNEIVPHYPSSYLASNVIGVASTNSSDSLNGGSHFGLSTIHLGAPGSGILSTAPGNNYVFMNGTSMATPHVSGAAALLLAANPNLTLQQLKSLLIFNGDSVPTLLNKTVTGRRLNVFNSLQAGAENDVTPPGTVTSFHLNTQNGRALNIGWTASGDDGAAGQAALYQLSFTDAATGAVIPLKNAIPVASGSGQTLDVKLPYRHTHGTLILREFDNVGNEGAPATLNVSVSLSEGDPYATALSSPAALSTGGTAQSLIGDDKIKNYTLPFAFPFFGENFSALSITTNGNLFFSPPPTRSGGDADDVPSSVVGLASFKMISGLWDDLRTDRNAGDDVYVIADSTHVIFRWKGVTFGDGTPGTEFPVNFEIELLPNGTIHTRYGTGNTNLFPVVGIGGGEPEAYFIPSHTSEQTAISLTDAQQVTFTPQSGPPPTPAPLIQFALPQFDVIESNRSVTVTVIRSGFTSTEAFVDYRTSDGSATQKGDYIQTTGKLGFAPGETSKTFTVFIIDDIYQEGTETFNVILSNPAGMDLGPRSTAAVAIYDNDFAPPPNNPLDNSDARFFVRQHYLDFLNREPDASGLAFWADQITSCGSNQGCIEVRRINVSAAFFRSIEFQETGYLVERLYKTAYGDATGTSTLNGTHQLPVPIVRYQEFLSDSQEISRGVVVGQTGWETVLENNKQSFIGAFAQRIRFLTAFPPSMSPIQFVDTLNANAGGVLSASERSQLIADLTSATKTRAQVLRAVAEDSDLRVAEDSRAFVLMQYFGYMRRNPNDAPEFGLDYTGYDFWLTKLNQFNGNYITAEMVKAFITAGEYRQRFGP